MHNRRDRRGPERPTTAELAFASLVLKLVVEAPDVRDRVFRDHLVRKGPVDPHALPVEFFELLMAATDDPAAREWVRAYADEYGHGRVAPPRGRT